MELVSPVFITVGFREVLLGYFLTESRFPFLLRLGENALRVFHRVFCEKFFGDASLRAFYFRSESVVVSHEVAHPLTEFVQIL